MMNQEFIDRIEGMRVNADNTYAFMLAVVKGDEEAVATEASRKKAIADEIVKEKYKANYSEAGSYAEMLALAGKTKITEEELESVMDTIAQHFANKPFKSKDLLPLIDKNPAGEPFLNNRKLPSRLKKLAEFGRLEDCGGKPKAYKLVVE